MISLSFDMNLSAALDCFLNVSLSFDKNLHIWYLNLEIFSKSVNTIFETVGHIFA